MTLPAAGWYADPVDPTRLRWWDGAQWTQATTPAPSEPEGQPVERLVEQPVAPSVEQPASAAAHEPAPEPSYASSSFGQPASPEGRSPAQPQQADAPATASGTSPAQPASPWGPVVQQPPQQPPQHLTQQPGYPGAVQPGYPQPYALGYPGDVVPGGAAQATPDGQPPAGLGVRFGAWLIDGFISMFAAAAAAAPLLITAVTRMVDYMDSSGALDPVNPTPLTDPFAIYTDSGALGPLIGAGLVALIVRAVYYITFTGWKGGTPGKLMLGLRVRSWDTPVTPTYGQATKRWLTQDVPAQVVPLYGLLDLLWPLWDTKKQALHDKWPGTVVVRK